MSERARAYSARPARLCAHSHLHGYGVCRGARGDDGRLVDEKPLPRVADGRQYALAKELVVDNFTDEEVELAA